MRHLVYNDFRMCGIRKIKVNDFVSNFQVFDATQKIQSGILDGNFYGLGHFDMCLNINAGPNFRNITGKYCLGDIPLSEEAASK